MLPVGQGQTILANKAMRGSINWQVQQVYATVKDIGQSKHNAKAEARAGGAQTWAQLGKAIGIHSYATADAYRAVWRSALEYAKTEYGVNNLEKLTGQHVNSYLESKVDQGVARATFDQYAAALSKLEVALNRYAEQKETGNQYQFDMKTVRALGAQELGGRSEQSRAYAAPDKLVSAVGNYQHELAAALQREGGARVSEINHVTKEQLLGVRCDKHSGVAKGWIEVQGKGGKERQIGVSPETYQKLLMEVAQSGARFVFDEDRYRESLKSAATDSRQDYQGSHGLRWNWAQERHAELQKMGMTYEQSLSAVSQEMGHERGDITEHYLK